MHDSDLLWEPRLTGGWASALLAPKLCSHQDYTFLMGHSQPKIDHGRGTSEGLFLQDGRHFW